MRYGILSDIHSNLEALERVLRFFKELGVDEYYCLGDIVGYGANPKECLQIIRSLGVTCVAGNHDWAVAGKLNPDNFHPDALEGVYWTRNQLSDEEINCLRGLSLVHKTRDAEFVHAMLSKPERFQYMAYSSEAVETFSLMARPLCFIGHTHVPQIICMRNGKAQSIKGPGINCDPGQKYILNVGSVGQPRDGNPMAACGIYDTDSRYFEAHRVAYDIAIAQEKILRAGLPASLAERLSLGR